MNDDSILTLQLMAAVLMGSDYFLSRTLRDKIKDPLRMYFAEFKVKSSSEFTRLWDFSIQNKWKTVYPAVYMLLYNGPMLCWGHEAMIQHLGPTLLAAASLIGMCCLFLFF